MKNSAIIDRLADLRRRWPRWHCTFCKADKPLPAPVDALATLTRCPDCKNNSCIWLEFTPRPRRAVTGQPWLKRQAQ